MSKWKNVAYSVSFVVIASYVGVCAYFYVIQESILFHPRQLSEQAVYNYSFDFEERWFEPEEGVRIHAIHAYADSSRGLIIFLPGNAGMNRTRPEKYTLFTEQGFDVIYPDYRGFGKSRGELSNQDEMISDTQFIYSAMMNEYEEKEMVLLGYSLGSGVAAQIARKNDPAMLILWTPYLSLVDMKDSQFPFLPDALLKYPFRTDEALQEVNDSVFIFFAENDQVLPLERSIHLRDYLKEGDDYFILKDQGHDGLYRNTELKDKLTYIVNTID